MLDTTPNRRAKEGDTMELKPCPFCGQTEYLCVWAEGIKENRQYLVVCDVSHDGGCGASSGWKNTIMEAKEAWNRRADQ